MHARRGRSGVGHQPLRRHSLVVAAWRELALKNQGDHSSDHGAYGMLRVVWSRERAWRFDEYAKYESMVDLLTETVIAIREIPRYLPARPNGKRVHISACYRWIQRGVRGVKLEALRVGGTMYTSVEALERFGLRLTDGASGTRTSPESSARKRQVNQASQRLRNLLGEMPSKEKNRDSGNGQPESTPKQ